MRASVTFVLFWEFLKCWTCWFNGLLPPREIFINCSINGQLYRHWELSHFEKSTKQGSLTSSAGMNISWIHFICLLIHKLLVYFKVFFLMWTIFKVFIEFVTILPLLYALVFWPQGYGIFAPWPGIESKPSSLEGEVLTTGPPVCACSVAQLCLTVTP